MYIKSNLSHTNLRNLKEEKLMNLFSQPKEQQMVFPEPPKMVWFGSSTRAGRTTCSTRRTSPSSISPKQCERNCSRSNEPANVACSRRRAEHLRAAASGAGSDPQILLKTQETKGDHEHDFLTRLGDLGGLPPAGLVQPVATA